MELKRELLNPEVWADVLKVCAEAMQVAVALTDSDGQPLGICHNPQHIWSLARAAKPEWGSDCLFCLKPKGDAKCTAADEARRTGSVVLAHDRGGFAHVALPLSFGDRHLGTLLAGQIFDRFPNPLEILRISKEFDLSAQQLWYMARHQVRVGGSNLMVYGRLLHTFSQALLQQRYGAILKRQLATSAAELLSANQELEQANASLLANVAELSKSNAEKVVLMQEVHHRVNNNLQVIASLLRMQAESYGDHQVADALRTTQMRIDSMALVHAQLYESEYLREVKFGEYAASLADNLFLAYGVDPQRISLAVNMGSFEMTVDQAIPAGLILSELISNAIKYAFPKQRRGSILIEGACREERIELTVRDDGVGIPAQPEPQRRKSRGLQIVQVLCSQLRATLEQTCGDAESGSGTVFRISFSGKALLKASA